MSTSGAMILGHTGETSFDPNNLTGQIFMRGKRENTFLQLIGGLNGIVGIHSRDFDCGQEYEVPDHRTLPERVEGGLAKEDRQAFSRGVRWTAGTG